MVEVDFGVVAAVFALPAFGVLLGICGVIEQKRQRRQRAAGLANQAPPRQFNIILPGELADAVQAKVASGAYATGNDVILAGVRTLVARYLPSQVRSRSPLRHWSRIAQPFDGSPRRIVWATRGFSAPSCVVKTRSTATSTFSSTRYRE